MVLMKAVSGSSGSNFVNAANTTCKYCSNFYTQILISNKRHYSAKYTITNEIFMIHVLNII